MTLFPTGLESFKFSVLTVSRDGSLTEFNDRTATYYSVRLTVEDFYQSFICLDMIAIPAGSFNMGGEDNEQGYYERPQHKVNINPFFMAKYPITQMQWEAIASRNELKVSRDLIHKPAFFKERSDSYARPVEQVDWDDAVEFCARISKLTGQKYRLPSEAEWEYACRAGTTTPFHFGETITSELANYDASLRYSEPECTYPKGTHRQQTTPVTKFLPNAFGLCDMHGNVWEWCLDNRHDDYIGAPTDGSEWLGSDNSHIIRGGAWCNPPQYCRSASRSFSTISHYDIGFRVVCSTS